MLVAEDLRDGFHINAVFDCYRSEAMAQLVGGGGDADVLAIVIIESFETAFCEWCFSVIGNYVVALIPFRLQKLCLKGSEKRNDSDACGCLWSFNIGLIALVSYGLCYVDQIVLEINVLPLQGENLALAQTGVDRYLWEEPGIVGCSDLILIGGGGGRAAFFRKTWRQLDCRAGVLGNLTCAYGVGKYFV